jgi:hypothetical protein
VLAVVTVDQFERRPDAHQVGMVMAAKFVLAARCLVEADPQAGGR